MDSFDVNNINQTSRNGYNQALGTGFFNINTYTKIGVFNYLFNHSCLDTRSVPQSEQGVLEVRGSSPWSILAVC